MAYFAFFVIAANKSELHQRSLTDFNHEGDVPITKTVEAQNENDKPLEIKEKRFQSMIQRSIKRQLEEEIGLSTSIFKKPATVGSVLGEGSQNILTLPGSQHVSSTSETSCALKSFTSLNNNSATSTRTVLSAPVPAIARSVTPPSADISGEKNYNIGLSGGHESVVDLSVAQRVVNLHTSGENVEKSAKQTPSPPLPPVSLMPYTSLLSDDPLDYSHLFMPGENIEIPYTIPTPVSPTEIYYEPSMEAGSNYSLHELTTHSGINVEKPNEKNNLKSIASEAELSLTGESTTALSRQESTINTPPAIASSTSIDKSNGTDGPTTTRNHDGELILVENSKQAAGTSSDERRTADDGEIEKSVDQGVDELTDYEAFQEQMAPHFDDIIAFMPAGKSELLILFIVFIIHA